MNNRDIELINLNYYATKEETLIILQELKKVNVEQLMFGITILKMDKKDLTNYTKKTKLDKWVKNNKFNKSNIINNYNYYKKYIKYILIELFSEQKIKYDDDKIWFIGEKRKLEKGNLNNIINLINKSSIKEIRGMLNET